MKPATSQRRQDERFLAEATAVLHQFGYESVLIRRPPSGIIIPRRVLTRARRMVYLAAVHPGMNVYWHFPIRRSRPPARKVADLVRMLRKARKQGFSK